MTKDKDEKAVIRARMERTGESYAAARAQLSREAGTPSDDAEPGRRQPGRPAVSTTLAAGRALQRAGHQSAWHLVLALREVPGVAQQALLKLDFPASLTAPGRDDEPGRAGVTEGFASAVGIAGGSPFVDTGLLLRGALDAVDPASVPASQRPLLDLLRSADVTSLTATARQALPAEHDDARNGDGMFNRFTDRARVVLVRAQEAARELQHDFIGTEHLLLGMLAEGGGVAAVVLRQMGITEEQVRTFILDSIGAGPHPPGDAIPFTPRSKKLLELALRAALQLGHNYIGTEHLLLALADEGQGIAAQLLAAQGLTAAVVRERVLALLADVPQPRADPPAAT